MLLIVCGTAIFCSLSALACACVGMAITLRSKTRNDCKKQVRSEPLPPSEQVWQSKKEEIEPYAFTRTEEREPVAEKEVGRVPCSVASPREQVEKINALMDESEETPSVKFDALIAELARRAEENQPRKRKRKER